MWFHLFSVNVEQHNNRHTHITYTHLLWRYLLHASRRVARRRRHHPNVPLRRVMVGKALYLHSFGEGLTV